MPPPEPFSEASLIAAATAPWDVYPASPEPSHGDAHLLPRHDAHASPALEHPLDRLQLEGLPPGPQEQLNSVLVHELFRFETWLPQLDCRQLAHAALPAELAAAGQFVPEYDEEPPELLLLLEHASVVATTDVSAQDHATSVFAMCVW